MNNKKFSTRDSTYGETGGTPGVTATTRRGKTSVKGLEEKTKRAWTAGTMSSHEETEDRCASAETRPEA